MNLDNLPNFNEVSQDKTFTEKFVKLDTILDKPLIVLDYCDKVFKDKKGNLVDKIHIQVEIDNERRVISTASSVLIKQIKGVSTCPFKAKIAKVSNFYSFTGV